MQAALTTAAAAAVTSALEAIPKTEGAEAGTPSHERSLMVYGDYFGGKVTLAITTDVVSIMVAVFIVVFWIAVKIGRWYERKQIYFWCLHSSS